MDPTTTLWIVSILAAAGFTATGYFLARFRAEEAKPIETRPEPPKTGPEEAPTPIVPPVVEEESIPEAPITLPQFSAEPAITPEAPRELTGPPPPITVTGPSPAPRETDLAKTKPPPPIMKTPPRIEVSPRSRDERIEPEGGAPRLVDQDLGALERDLRTEVTARREAEKRAADLMSRLVSSSQQIAALRAKLGMADDIRRPTSMPPNTRTSERPLRETGSQRAQALAPGLFSEIEDLRREVERLKSENETLRVAAFMKRQ